MPSLEEILFQALEEERALSEERALLPGLLQHDLANALCQVSLSASMAQAVTTDAQRARYLRDIEGGIKRMNDLLVGMRFLFLTRNGAADHGEGDLAKFVRDLVEEPGAWPSGGPITLVLPGSLRCSFSPTLVRHAIVNLVGNALVYSRNTWVRLRLAPVRGTTWQLSVSNGGPGIPANHVPYLFDLDQSGAFSEKVGGGGLGLYIARMCAHFLGSPLRLRTKPGLTVFSFNLREATLVPPPVRTGPPLSVVSHAS